MRHGPVRAAVERLLRTLPTAERRSWRAQVARTLAEELDTAPNASMARELRAVVAELEADRVPERESVVDDLARRRAARRAAAASQ